MKGLSSNEDISSFNKSPSLSNLRSVSGSMPVHHTSNASASRSGSPVRENGSLRMDKVSNGDNNSNDMSSADTLESAEAAVRCTV